MDKQQLLEQLYELLETATDERYYKIISRAIEIVKEAK